MSQGNMGGVFDAEQVQPGGDGDFSSIPSGKYKTIITASEWKDSKKTAGAKYLELTHEVVDGEHKGRKLWDRLNLVNPSQQASEIAQKTLSAICHAIGVMKVADSSQLHDRPMLTTVRVVPKNDKEGRPVIGADGKPETTNEIKGYAKLDQGITPLPTATAAPAAAVNAGPVKAPWDRKSA